MLGRGHSNFLYTTQIDHPKPLETHLRRTLANALVTTEQFHTLLTQIETLLNSRPLTQLNKSPADLDVLTPGQIVVHRPLTAILEPSYEELPSYRLSQWQQIQEYLRRRIGGNLKVPSQVGCPYNFAGLGLPRLKVYRLCRFPGL